MALVVWAPRTLAGDAAALILEADGGIMPAVEAFDQIAAGTALELDEGARLRVAHLALCTVVTLAGSGRLEIAERTYAWSGAPPTTSLTGSCVHRVTYATADMEPAGIGLRVTESPRLAPRPVFVLEDFKASARYEVSIERLGDGGEDILLGLPHRVSAWPDEVPPLERGRAYRVILIRDGKPSAPSPAFIVPAGQGANMGEAPLLLRFH